jgi:hypothetical protein
MDPFQQGETYICRPPDDLCRYEDILTYLFTELSPS